MRSISLAAAALIVTLSGCGDLYGDRSDAAYRSNAGFTRENPPPVGPPVTRPSSRATRPAMGSGLPSDSGANPGQGAPIGGP